MKTCSIPLYYSLDWQRQKSLRMCHVGENLKPTDTNTLQKRVNWYNLNGGKTVKSYQNVFKMHAPFLPTIPLPEMYPTDMFAHMSNDL